MIALNNWTSMILNNLMDNYFSRFNQKKFGKIKINLLFMKHKLLILNLWIKKITMKS